MPGPLARRAAATTMLAAAALSTVAACGESAADRDPSGALRVVTTVAPLTSIVSEVAGDRARVDGLVPEGTNSHTFEPPPSASRVLAEADVIFLNGLQLEEPTRELAERTKRPDAAVVELGTTVLPRSDYLFDFSFPEEEGKPNPHLWTDPTYAIRYAALVRDKLAGLDPDGQADYQANYAVFERKATELADALRSDQRSLPRERRQLLTYHDAYAYFAKTFGWTVVGAIQPRNFEDPTPREVATLIDQIRRRQVRAIFGSEVFPSKVLEQIGSATGTRYVDVLRDDDLPGRPGEAEHSWLGLMRFDFQTMIEALGGRAPALRALDIRTGTATDAHYPQ